MDRAPAVASLIAITDERDRRRIAQFLEEGSSVFGDGPSSDEQDEIPSHAPAHVVEREVFDVDLRLTEGSHDSGKHARLVGDTDDHL